MQRIRSQLRRMPLRGREPADRLIDTVYIDQSSIENTRVIDEFGNGSRGCASGPASLSVEGDGSDPTILYKERDPRQIPTSSAPCGTRKGTVSNRTDPAVVTKVVLKKLPLHAVKGRALYRRRPSRAITHTYLLGGCG